VAWYDDQSKLSYLGTYKNEKEMRKDLEQAIRKGWKLQDTAADGGHVNIGRTATGAVLTGNTLVFVRDEAYMARLRLQQSLANAKAAYERLAKAEEDENAAAAAFGAQRASAEAFVDLLREREEKSLREALEDVIKRRTTALAARDQFVAAGTVVHESRAAALPLGITASDDLLVLVDRLDEFSQKQADRRALADAERCILPLFATVERGAKDYSRAHERVKDIAGKRDAAQRKVEEGRTALASATPDKEAGVQRRLADAEKELGKKESELTAAQSTLDGSAATLTYAMKSRDAASAALPVNAASGV
jgi:hypothetical protein